MGRIKYPSGFKTEVIVNCTRFVSPLRLYKREKPKNFENILSVLNQFSSFDLLDDWISLITRQFDEHSQDISFNNDQLMTTFRANPKTRLMFFAIFFTILTMLGVFFMLATSKTITNRISKAIKFEKYYQAYTFIPVYCCLNILSLTVSFGLESTKALQAMENAQNWNVTAINRNNYLFKRRSDEIDCSTKLPSFKRGEIDKIENHIFEITSSDINQAFQKAGKVTVKKINLLNDMRRIQVETIREQTASIYKLFEQRYSHTLELLKIPGTIVVHIARISIFLVTFFSVLTTFVILLMGVLGIRNRYKFTKIIEVFSPFLLLLIIIEFLFIWYIFTTIVGSYTVYLNLSHPEIHTKISFAAKNVQYFFKKLGAAASSKSRKYLNNPFTWKMIKMNILEVSGGEKMIKEVMEKVKGNGEFSKFYDYFKKCLEEDGKFCEMNMSEIIKKYEENVRGLHPSIKWTFAIPAKSYLRYLSFFRANTFVPIASVVWKILCMPVLIFFNMIFVHFSIAVIRNRDELETETERD